MALGENFETVKEFAAGVVQTAAEKTKQLATIAKANAAILAEENKIKKAQLELGKLYYKDFALDEEPDEAEYLPWCDKITESLKVIEEMKATIEAFKAEPEEAVEAPIEEIVVEEIPAEEAPAEETPVEDAPAEDAPIEIVVEDDNNEAE